MPAAQLCAEWNRQLTGTGLRITPAYRHTGNFLMTATDTVPTTELSQIVSEALVGRFAVFSTEEFLDWLPRLKIALASPPAPSHGRRLTPGAAMSLDLNAGAPDSVPAADHFVTGPFTIPRVQGVWKNDALRGDGRALDRNRRDGGWGAIAKAFDDALGGQWTARALSTLEGVAERLAESDLVR